jgi:hypothetical protein
MCKTEVPEGEREAEISAILEWLGDSIPQAPPAPCSDSAAAIEPKQRYGSDYQYREIVSSWLQEDAQGRVALARGHSLPLSGR